MMHTDWNGSYDESDGCGWFTRRYACGCSGRVDDYTDSEEYSWSVKRGRVLGEQVVLAAGNVIRESGAEFWSGEEVTALVDAVHESVCEKGAVR